MELALASLLGFLTGLSIISVKKKRKKFKFYPAYMYRKLWIKYNTNTGEVYLAHCGCADADIDLIVKETRKHSNDCELILN